MLKNHGDCVDKWKSPEQRMANKMVRFSAIGKKRKKIKIIEKKKDLEK